MRKVADLDTPALLVDVDVLDHNIRRIADACAARDVRWRPHIKGLKTAEVAQRALNAGARGLTCAKLSEAEAFADAGFDDFLIANQVVGTAKLARLVALLRRASVLVAIDHPEQARAIGVAAVAAGVTAPVVLEVEIGMNRAGVAAGSPAVALARTVASTPGVRFAGVMAWEGQTTRIADPAQKKRAIEEAVADLVETARRIEAAGLPVEIVSCGGTGTYPVSAAISGVTEIQAGGGVFSDVCYRSLYNIDHPYALSVISIVTSRPTPRRIVCDAGKKSMSGETALPIPLGVHGARPVRLSAEHATLELEADDDMIRIGDRLRFVVGYADTTVHLHEEMYAVRGDEVVGIWPIIARGKTR